MRRFLSCVAVAALGAALTGAFAAGLDAVRLLIVDSPRPSPGDALVDLLDRLRLYVLTAVCLGIVPAIAVVWISRARVAPWRAFPILLAGSFAGLLALYAAVLALRSFQPMPGVLYLSLLAAPTLGAIAASFRLPRVPQSAT